MMQPTFLDRKTFGWPNYFWIAMVFAFLVAMVPGAARQALHSNTNKAEDWLPDTYTESKDLKWFRRHFISEGFILATWDGCTLGNAEKLKLLEQKLRERIQEVRPMAIDSLRPEVTAETGKWFRKVFTGPSMIDELTRPPLSLSYAEAIRRLEGALVGPAKVGPDGKKLDDTTRVTALVCYLSPEGYKDNKAMRNVVKFVQDVAINECGIPEPQLHMGGPIVDNVAIDRAGEGSLVRLASLSGLVGLAIAYWCLRNFKLTAVVVAVGAISAMVSLALVHYFGVIETLLLGRARPFYGTMDAILMSMPALVYVLGVSGAIHFVNYYREARVAGGVGGAVERAVRGAWIPCGLVALTAAIGFGSLVTSDIVPIRKFGGFSAAGIMATMGVLFSVLPVYLHRFPPASIGKRAWDEMSPEDDRLPPWGTAFYRWLADHNLIVTGAMLTVMAIAGFGLTQLQSEVRLLKLLDEKADLVQDYTWVEEHMGNLVPMEVVLTIPPEKFRAAGERADVDGQYRMTLLERLGLVRKVVARIEQLEEVSRALSAATLAPAESQGTTKAARTAEDNTTNKHLEEHLDSFKDYLQIERNNDGEVTPSSRELWRISSRVTALRDIDYGLFTDQLRVQVEPVIAAYGRRNMLVAALHEDGKSLKDASFGVVCHEQIKDTPEGLLIDLLSESAGVTVAAGVNAELLNSSQLSAQDRAAALEQMRQLDAVLLVTEELRPAAEKLAAEGVKIVDVTEVPADNIPVIAETNLEEGPRPIRSLYTGIIPLVFKTQRQLLISLRSSLFSSGFLIVVVMAIVFRSALAGAVSMLPNIFPVLLVFGSLGLLGVKMDIGIVMTASVALGVAVDSTVHLVTWFYHGQARGLDRRNATLMAYEHCATATVQGAMISGLGLAVFAASSFTPTRQFGYLMITIQSAALLGDLVMLPAILCGPLGRFFERKHRREADTLGDIEGEGTSTERRPPWQGAEAVSPPTEVPHRRREKAPAGANGKHAPQGEPVASATERRENGHSPTPPAHHAPESEPVASAHQALREKLRTFRRD